MFSSFFWNANVVERLLTVCVYVCVLLSTAEKSHTHTHTHHTSNIPCVSICHMTLEHQALKKTKITHMFDIPQ